jgi:uncharacterized protein
MLARYCYSLLQREPLARKLARWRAALSADHHHPPHLGTTTSVVVDAGAGAAAPELPRALEQQQQSPETNRPHHHHALPPAPSFAASGVAVVAVGAHAARAFSSSPSPSFAHPPPSRPPPRSGAGLGGGAGGGSGGGGLASVIAAEAGRTRVNAYTDDGFVVNQVHVKGAILCLPETWLMWDVDLEGYEDDSDDAKEGRRKITSGGAAPPNNEKNDLDALVPPETLAVLDLVHPPPEVLVLGCGARAPARPPARLRAWLRERGASLELLRTADAVALFALLNDEGRPAVGAFLPPNVVLGD